MVMLLMWVGRHHPLAHWFMAALAVVIVFGPGLYILKMAWASVRRRILNQHVLMEISAFGGLAGLFTMEGSGTWRSGSCDEGAASRFRSGKRSRDDKETRDMRTVELKLSTIKCEGCVAELGEPLLLRVLDERIARRRTLARRPPSDHARGYGACLEDAGGAVIVSRILPKKRPRTGPGSDASADDATRPLAGSER